MQKHVQLTKALVVDRLETLLGDKEGTNLVLIEKNCSRECVVRKFEIPQRI